MAGKNERTRDRGKYHFFFFSLNLLNEFLIKVEANYF